MRVRISKGNRNAATAIKASKCLEVILSQRSSHRGFASEKIGGRRHVLGLELPPCPSNSGAIKGTAQ